MLAHTRGLVLALIVALLCGCPTQDRGGEAAGRQRATARAYCPAELPAPPILPFERPMHGSADFWLSRVEAPNQPLLLPGQISAHNARVATLRKDGWPVGRWSLLRRPVDQPALDRRLGDKIRALQQAVAQGKRLLAGGAKPEALVRTIIGRMRGAARANELRIATRETPIRCYPTTKPMYDAPWSVAFDMMQCAQLRPGEGVRVVRKSARFWYIWSSYTEGWVDGRALSSPLSVAAARQQLEGDALVIITRDRVALRNAPGGALTAMLRWGLRLPLRGRRDDWLEVDFPGAPGGHGWIPADAAHQGYLPLTREALLRAAFAELDAPYGWGGMGGHRDCSRLLMDLFGLFGLWLPRNSWQQAHASRDTVDVGAMSEGDKIAAIEAAARRGAVLLYLPGHIGLYLGRDGDQLYALHQFSGYLVPCPGGGETMYRANRTAVTALELGRGGSRRAFIERITRLVIIGQGSATSRPVSSSE